jgi:spore maturation protein CgeB
MNKIRIAFLYKAFPLTMANYYRRALERRDDVELFTVGEFFGQSIPWDGGMTIPNKYLNHVDLPLNPGMNKVSWESIKPSLPWEPDLILNVDAGFHLTTKPDVPYAVVATDPHVLGNWYAGVRPLADFFFNMQHSYMQAGDHFLPYAFDTKAHYPMSSVEKDYDCAIVGLHYPQRDEWVRRLRALGTRVNYRIGDIYDEYREQNNRAFIGLNWSSLQDVTARVFELMAMRLVPVLNRLPGLDYMGFEDGRHYLGFSSMDEAVEKVQWALANREFAQQIADQAYQFVQDRNMTWESRVDTILKTCGLV